MAAGDLFALAKEYLAACEVALASSPGGSLGRNYISPGPPAWDCEQCTVHVGAAGEGDTAPLQPPLQPGVRWNTGTVNLIYLTATVLRCVPVPSTQGAPPSAQALGDAAAIINGDLWAIVNHVREAKRAGTLFPSDGGKREMFVDVAVALNTSGGLAGWQIPLRVQLDGF